MTIVDETATGESIREFAIPVDSATITLKEVIATRVEEEVRRYNSTLPEFFNGLVQPTEAEQTLNGYRVKGNRTIDAEKQIYIALAAFQKNGYFVLVDDQQVDDLNEEITLKEKSKVSFIKLTPLVGG